MTGITALRAPCRPSWRFTGKVRAAATDKPQQPLRDISRHIDAEPGAARRNDAAPGMPL
jgi:hypothetical protein